MEDIKKAFHTFGFWFLIFFMLGMVGGSYSMYLYQCKQMNDAVKVGGFVFDKKVYELKEKVN